MYVTDFQQSIEIWWVRSLRYRRRFRWNGANSWSL